jgi:hypothetical protein
MASSEDEVAVNGKQFLKTTIFNNTTKKVNSAKVSNRRLTWRRRTFVFHQSKIKTMNNEQ